MLRAIKSCLVLIAVLALSSCRSIEEKNTLFFITLHQIVPTPEQYDGGMVMVVKSSDDSRERHVRTIPLISSAYINKIDVIPGKDSRHWGLRLHCDEVANGLWHEAFHYRKGDEVAVLVDGFLAGFSTIGHKKTDDGVIELDGLWNRQEALAIAAQAERNHHLYDVKRIW